MPLFFQFVNSHSLRTEKLSMLGNLTLQDKVPNNFSVFIFLGPPQQSCGATLWGSLFARPCGGFAALVWRFAPPRRIARPLILIL